MDQQSGGVSASSVLRQAEICQQFLDSARCQFSSFLGGNWTRCSFPPKLFVELHNPLHPPLDQVLAKKTRLAFFSNMCLNFNRPFETSISRGSDDGNEALALGGTDRSRRHRFCDGKPVGPRR
jgi:hypothetical protein